MQEQARRMDARMPHEPVTERGYRAEPPYYLNEYETSARIAVDGTVNGHRYEVGEYIRCHGVFATYEEASGQVEAMERYIAERQHGLHRQPGVRNPGWPIVHVERAPGADFSNAPAQHS